MLHTPKHITNGNIATAEIHFEWDEWNVQPYFQGCTDDIEEMLQMLSDRGNMALAIACAEWVYHRFSAVNDDTFPLDFIEAAWASNVFLQYGSYCENAEDDWRGIVRCPLNIMMIIINEGLWTRDDNPQVSDYSLWMINLTRHILPEAAIPDFENWLGDVALRMSEHCKGTEVLVPEDSLFPEDYMDDPEGDHVPHELFDTTQPYDHSQHEQLIDAFLRSLDPTQNTQLHSTEWLDNHEEQFERTEYRHPFP